jgi:hypothetical protein
MHQLIDELMRLSGTAEAATWKAPKKNGLHNSEAIATFKGRQTIITASHNFYRDWQGGIGPPAAALAAEKSVQFAGLTGTQAELNSSRSLSPQRGDISSMFSKPALLAAPLSPLALAVAVLQPQQQLLLEPLRASDTDALGQSSDACSTSSDAQEGRRSRMNSNSSSQERRGRLVSSSSAPTLKKQLSSLQRQQSSNAAGVLAAISVVGTAAQLSCQGSSKTISNSTSPSTRKPSAANSSTPVGASPGRSNSRQSSVSFSPASRRASAAPSNSPTARSGAKKDNSLAHTAPAAMLAAAMTAAAAADAAATEAAAAAAAAAPVNLALLRRSSSRSVLAREEDNDSVEGTAPTVTDTTSETVTAKLSPRGQLKLPDVATTSSTQRPLSRCGSVSPRLPQVSTSSTIGSGTSSSKVVAL